MWVVILTLGLVKLPIAALMLWLPFRSDEAMAANEPADSAEEDGGSKTLPGGSRNPHHPRVPRHGPSPRRGPHGSVAPPSPARVRGPRRGARRIGV
jgi:hypothetical protein